IEGPIFCQLLMADEINRASPRTQSALLQAMQEKEVTIAGEHRPLGVPFHVLATQNPIEQEGTYPLPEAQLDRFLVQIDVPYPDRQTEKDILIATTGSVDAKSSQIFTAQELLDAQALLRRMPVGENIVEMILDLVRACRPGDANAPDIIRHNVQGLLGMLPGEQ
ncbi:MAG: AAA family ATPase, partial [Paracoccaceae bacterium]|nr:AAA family ATPase [Paracoccaceae bacterium]